MTPPHVFCLLDELCIQLGVCLPTEAYERLSHNPPGDADLFTYVVFRAEGLDPDADSPLRDRVRAVVVAHMERASASDDPLREPPVRG